MTSDTVSVKVVRVEIDQLIAGTRRIEALVAARGLVTVGVSGLDQDS